MFERLGAVLVFVGFVIVGVTFMSAFTVVNANADWFVVVSVSSSVGILQGIGWIVIGFGLMLRLWPEDRSLADLD